MLVGGKKELGASDALDTRRCSDDCNGVTSFECIDVESSRCEDGDKAWRRPHEDRRSFFGLGSGVFVCKGHQNLAYVPLNHNKS